MVILNNFLVLLNFVFSWHGWWDMGCQPIYIFFVLWLKISMWNFILRYFIINYLIKKLSFSQNICYCYWYIGIKHASKHCEVLRMMRFVSDFELIYLLLDTYILLLEELDTKHLFRDLVSRLIRGFATLVS